MSDDAAKAAANAKASVHEAIGKLIGDDAAKDRGAAERSAGDAAAPDGDEGTAGVDRDRT